MFTFLVDLFFAVFYFVCKCTPLPLLAGAYGYHSSEHLPVTIPINLSAQKEALSASTRRCTEYLKTKSSFETP